MSYSRRCFWFYIALAIAMLHGLRISVIFASSELASDLVNYHVDENGNTIFKLGSRPFATSISLVSKEQYTLAFTAIRPDEKCLKGGLSDSVHLSYKDGCENSLYWDAGNFTLKGMNGSLRNADKRDVFINIEKDFVSEHGFYAPRGRSGVNVCSASFPVNDKSDQVGFLVYLKIAVSAQCDINLMFDSSYEILRTTSEPPSTENGSYKETLYIVGIGVGVILIILVVGCIIYLLVRIWNRNKAQKMLPSKIKEPASNQSFPQVSMIMPVSSSRPALLAKEIEKKSEISMPSDNIEVVVEKTCSSQKSLITESIVSSSIPKKTELVLVDKPIAEPMPLSSLDIESHEMQRGEPPASLEDRMTDGSQKKPVINVPGILKMSSKPVMASSVLSSRSKTSDAGSKRRDQVKETDDNSLSVCTGDEELLM